MELERRTEKERAAYFAGFQAGVAAVGQALEAGAHPAAAVANARTIADQALEAERRAMFGGPRGSVPSPAFDRLERGGRNRASSSVLRRALVLAIFLGTLLASLWSQAQVKVDDRDIYLDDGRTLEEAIDIGLGEFLGAKTIDVDPNAAGTVSAGLREAFAQCPGGGTTYGGCVLRLRCFTDYTIGPRASWATDPTHNNASSYWNSSSQGVDLLNLTNYDDVAIEGCGDSSHVIYAQATTSTYPYTHMVNALYRSLSPANRGSRNIRLRNFKLSWNESCGSTTCGADQTAIYLAGGPDHVLIEGMTFDMSITKHPSLSNVGPTTLVITGEPAFTPDLWAHDVMIRGNTFQIAGHGVTLDGCNACTVTNNHWNKLGVALNDANGASGGHDTRFIGIGNGLGIRITNNDFDQQENGDTYAGPRNYGIEVQQLATGGKPRGQAFGAVIANNVFYGMRREGDRGIGLIGGSGTIITGNTFHGGQCSGDALFSCRLDTDCSERSKGTCDYGRGAGVMFNLAYNGCPLTQMDQVVGNSFFKWDDYDESGSNYADNCPIKIQGPFNTDNTCPGYPVQDPNDVQNNLIADNLFQLSDPTDDGFCGDAATWASSKNTIRGNKVVGGSLECIGGFRKTQTGTSICAVGYNAATFGLVQDVVQIAKTSNYMVTDLECRGATLTNVGAAGSITFTLPTARVGLRCRFLLGATQTINIDPAGSNQILGLTNAGGDRILSDAVIGTMIELEAVSATQWVSGARVGTWTDNN